MWDQYEYEKAIAFFDEWKIILTNQQDQQKIEELDQSMGIELSDANNYFNPSDKSKIRALQRITKLPGEEFDFWSWIHKYIIDTKNIVIQDGYACAKREIKDLEFIIMNTKKGTKIKIISLSDKARNGSRFSESRDTAVDDGIVADCKFQKLKEKYPNKVIQWELKDEKQLLEDRHIQTDRFVIDLGHVLGSTYKDSITNKILCKKQFTITVSKNLQQLIEI
jgi:hypothetical protein